MEHVFFFHLLDYVGSVLDAPSGWFALASQTTSMAEAAAALPEPPPPRAGAPVPPPSEEAAATRKLHQGMSDEDANSPVYR